MGLFYWWAIIQQSKDGETTPVYSNGKTPKVSYHVHTNKVSQAFFSWQNVTEYHCSTFYGFPELQRDPGVDFQGGEFDLRCVHRTTVVTLQPVVILFDDFQLVQCNKYPTVFVTLKQLLPLVDPISETLATTFFLVFTRRKRKIAKQIDIERWPTGKARSPLGISRKSPKTF